MVRRTYNLGCKIEFVIACSPDPWLIGCTLFDEAAPCIPFDIVMEGMIIRIRKITKIEHGLGFWVGHIVLKCLIRIICLSQIPCQSQTNKTTILLFTLKKPSIFTITGTNLPMMPNVWGTSGPNWGGVRKENRR